MQKRIKFKSIQIDSREKAKNAPVAWTNYALFYNGELFITCALYEVLKRIPILRYLILGIKKKKD